MTARPDRPKIYHITHVDNLPDIFQAGVLMSDRAIVQRGGPAQAIGMSSIKRRRLNELRVPCHPSTFVGDYVPFYFCPRSIMLFLIHRANHPELTYRGGQEPIVHLVADLRETVEWAQENNERWCFSLANAGAYLTEFRAAWQDLDQLAWPAIAAGDFRDPDVKEGKQAEFLLESRFPIDLVRQIGVRSAGVMRRVEGELASLAGPPPVVVRRGWYY